VLGPSHETSAILASSANNPKSEASEILLGNIATVPFQELYNLLSHRTPAQIAKLAQQLQDLPPGKDSEAKIAAFFKAWARLDSIAALKAAITLKTPAARGIALGSTIEAADSAAAASIVRMLNEMSSDLFLPSQRANLLGNAVMKWAQVDPIAAANFLDKTSERGLVMTMAFSTVAESWAAADPEAAFTWAQHHNVPEAMSGALTGWWRKDHRGAEAYVVSHANEADGAQLANALSSQIFAEDPARAAKWMSEFPNAAARYQGNAGLAVQWALTDPKAASEWAASLPPNELSTPLNMAVNFWTRQDPQAVGQWVQALKGPARDAAVFGYSSAIAPQDPAAALMWAASISDAQSREPALQQIASEWIGRDPAAARAWIQGSSLPQTEKARLLTVPGK
jgi:hypothetical protein